MFSFLSDIKGQTGTLCLSLDGKVVHATGELSDEKLASTIYYMITDTSGLFKQKEPLKRITITFSSCVYTVALVNDQIFVVKRSLNN